MHVVERVAEFAETHRGRPIAPQVLHHAKRAVIDWHAALFPGARVAPATALERALAEELDHGDAHLALGRRASIRAAALINGAAAHTLEVDDIFREGIYHPGAPTIAAALAVAQSRRASGEQFLRAVIVGYEISTRIAAAMGRARAARPRQKTLRPCARHGRHFLRRSAAGVSHGLHVEAHARGTRGGGRC